MLILALFKSLILRPTIGHLDPLFVELMDQTKQLLAVCFSNQNALTMPVISPRSAGMEAVLLIWVEPGD